MYAFSILSLLCVPGSVYCGNYREHRTSAISRNTKAQSADIIDYPYHATVILPWDKICGGAILNTRFILTTALCTFWVTPEDIRVRIGSTEIDRGGILLQNQATYKHPTFDIENNWEYDASVLQLATEIFFQNCIAPIHLADVNMPLESGRMATVTGFGSPSFYGPYSRELKKLDLQILTNEKCKGFHSEDVVTGRMFCAGSCSAHDECIRNFGAPLVLDGIVIGMVSWSKESDGTGLYTKISAVRYFIDSVSTNSNS